MKIFKKPLILMRSQHDAQRWPVVILFVMEDIV